MGQIIRKEVPVTTSTSYANPLKEPSTCLLNPPTESFGKEYVDYHNELRNKIWKDSDGITDLKWDNNLAEKAQIWANYLGETCTYQNPSNLSGGQNVYMSYTAGNNIDNTVSNSKNAINTWYNSCEDCEDKDITCSPIHAGPYTQLIWKDARKIGCGKSRVSNCSNDKINELLKQRDIDNVSIPMITNREYIVCNYDVKPNANYLDYNVPKGKPENCPIEISENYEYKDENNFVCVS